MKIYVIIGDYGLNGNYVEDVSSTMKDLRGFVKQRNDELTKAKEMHPYMTGWSQWEIDTETMDRLQVDEAGN